MLKDIGKIIRFHRKKARLTLEGLALLAGISNKKTVFDIEKGKETVQLNTILKILRVLKIRFEAKSSLMEEYSEVNNENGKYLHK